MNEAHTTRRGNGTDGPKINGRPSFWFGASSVFRGAGFVVASPRAWPYALVPALLLSLLVAGFGTLSLTVVRELVLGWALGTDAPPAPDGSFGRFFAEVAAWAVTLVALAAGIVVALAITPPLSGPALERIVALREAELGAPPREDLGFFAEMLCGLRAQAFLLFFAVPIVIALWIVEIFFPPAAIVTAPLAFLVTSFSLAWNLFDYPLTLRGVRMRDRFGLAMRHKPAFFGFGIAFAILFWVPCLGVLLLPVGAAASTHLLWRILESDPEVLPTLPRPARRGSG